MAKALFIVNPNVVQNIVDYIRKNKKFNTLYDDYSYDKKFFITSREQLVDSKKLLDTVNHIYIQPELNWSRDQSKYFGYSVALEIIKSRKSLYQLNLCFISYEDRKDLLTVIKEKNHSLVKIFSHIQLPLLAEKLPERKISNDQWDFFKNYILTSSGLLDDLLHKVEMLKYNNDQRKLNEILTQITLQESLVGEEIVEQVNNYQKSPVKQQETFIVLLYNQLQKRLLEFRPHKIDRIELPKNFKLLLVEDNPSHADMLIKSLERYLTKDKNLFIYSDGEKALKELVNHTNEYNLILIDLELLDNDGFYQTIQGVDILTEVINNHPLSAFKVVTGLGRKGVKELLNLQNKDILSKKQLYSFDTDKEVNQLLIQMKEEFAEKESKYFLKFGPQIGIFNWDMTKLYLNQYWQDQDFKNRTLAWVEEYFQYFLNGELNKQMWDKTIPAPKNRNNFDANKFFERRFATFLLNRRILLFIASKNDLNLYTVSNWKDYSNLKAYEDFPENIIISLTNNEISITKQLIERAAFNKKTIEKNIQYQIETKNLFPEEIIFLENLSEDQEDDLQIKIEQNSEHIYTLCKTYFDLEDEDLQYIEVPLNLKDWTFNDLNNCWTKMMIEIRNNTGHHFTDILTSFIDDADFTQLVENELKVYIPSISNDLDYLFSLPL